MPPINRPVEAEPACIEQVKSAEHRVNRAFPGRFANLLIGPLKGDVNALFTAAERAPDILFVADNAGELVSDRLLLELLSLERVTAAVAGVDLGADAVSKAHLEDPANLSSLRVPSPVLFPRISTLDLQLLHQGGSQGGHGIVFRLWWRIQETPLTARHTREYGFLP